MHHAYPRAPRHTNHWGIVCRTETAHRRGIDPARPPDSVGLGMTLTSQGRAPVQRGGLAYQGVGMRKGDPTDHALTPMAGIKRAWAYGNPRMLFPWRIRVNMDHHRPMRNCDKIFWKRFASLPDSLAPGGDLIETKENGNVTP